MKKELKEIMFIEDDLDIQDVAKLSLASVGGFSVIMCDSGEEALARLQSCTPQLILLDVMMPSMDGPTLLQHIKKDPRLSKIPVVFITANAEPSQVEDYLKMGVCSVIAKPFDPMSLPNIIADIWHESSTHSA